MAIDNVQAVLSKQIGTNKCDIVTVAQQSNDRKRLLLYLLSSRK
jgi:hypothetical protein